MERGLDPKLANYPQMDGPGNQGAPEESHTAFPGGESPAGWGSVFYSEALSHRSSQRLAQVSERTAPKMPASGPGEVPERLTRANLRARCSFNPQEHAHLATDSNPTLPKRNRKRHVQLPGSAKQPGRVTCASMNCPPPLAPQSDGPPRPRSARPRPRPRLYHTHARSAEGQLPPTRPPRSRKSKGTKPPQSLSSRARCWFPQHPDPAPHGTSWVPAPEYAAQGQGRAGRSGEIEGSGRPGVRATPRGKKRRLGGASPYLSSWDLPLRMTRPAVHCGTRAWPWRGAAGRPTWLAPGGIKPRPLPLSIPRPIRFPGKDTLTRPPSWGRGSPAPLPESLAVFHAPARRDDNSGTDSLCCPSQVRRTSSAYRLFREAVCFSRGPFQPLHLPCMSYRGEQDTGWNLKHNRSKKR